MFVEPSIKNLRRFQMASRNSERAVYHVTPDASVERWIVSLENSNYRQEFETKTAAEKFAKEAAQNNGRAQLKVHRKDGNMDYESTYGDDPRNIPG
jgi:hypothetical protein